LVLVLLLHALRNRKVACCCVIPRIPAVNDHCIVDSSQGNASLIPVPIFEIYQDVIATNERFF
jgi:hypothetical protein